MSHKATTWLSDLPADDIGHSEFRILFHLCDCHNPSNGCFPTQAYLIEKTGSSNGTVNNALNKLEERGLIKRHRERDGTSKRQKPTRYILGFEMKKEGEPTPKSGDGAVSNLEADPSPIQRPTRLQPTGEKPVKNPELTSSAAMKRQEFKKKAVTAEAGFSESKAELTANFWAEQIAKGKRIPANGISISMADRMLRMGLVNETQLRTAGVID